MGRVPLGGPEERRIRVVVLDERPLPRAATRQVLSGDPTLNVIGEANSIREGEAFVLRTRPDVVVCGMNGPGVDYLDLFERLRRQGVGARVLLLASGANSRDALAAVQAGVDGYLLGDISPPELARAVHEVAEGATPLHSRVARVIVDAVAQSSRHAARAAMRECGLSDREVDVLALLASGIRDRDIAARLVLSKTTIKTHLRSIFRKLKVHTRVQAASIAIRHRLVAAGEAPDQD